MSKFESKVQKDLVTDAVFTESNEEFILPDYMPEIGRVLRVTASLFPEECYLGTEGAEFSGRVEYHLLYSNGEGALTEAPLLGRYRYRVPVGERQVMTAYTDEMIEGVAVRPSAPRKLGIRTRITASPHLLYEERVGVSLAALVGDAPAEICEGSCQVAERGAIPFGILHAENAFSIEDTLPEEVSLLSAEAGGMIENAEAKEGYLSVRGRIIVTLILQKTEGSPFVKTCTIPFEEDVTVDSCHAGDALSIASITATPTISFEEAGGDTSVLIGVDYTLSGIHARNTAVPVLRDFYVHGAKHNVDYRTATYPMISGFYVGNITAEGDAALPDDFLTGDKCLVPSFTVKEKTVSRLGDRGIITGTLSVLLLALGKTCGEKTELTLPFRAEFPLKGEAGEEERIWIAISPVGGDARITGKSVHLTTELAITARATSLTKLVYPASASMVASVGTSEDGCVTIYYPSDGDTLWSVGKAYARPLAELKKQNGFPSDGEPEASDKASLDGYAYLLIDSL